MRGAPWFACLLALPLPAQAVALGGQVRTLGERLRSQHAPTVASAAHEIARGGFKSHRSRLLASLQAWALRNDEAAEVVRLHLLDALLAVDAKVPAADLLPHLHGLTEVPACVLLVRESLQNERELLALFTAPVPADQRCRSVTWWAAGNALCAQRSPGFAAALLASIDFRLVVDVHLPDEGIGGRCGGCFFVDLGSEPRRRRPGFPPVPEYHFATQDDATERVFAPGRAPVAWNRASTSGDYRAGTSRHNLERPLIAGWLQTLVPTDLAWGVMYARVHYTDDATYAAAVHGARTRFVQAQRDLRDQLVVRGHLTPQEAAAIETSDSLEVCDYRGERVGPLPEVPLASPARAR